MSYSVSGSGHGAKKAEAEAAFVKFVAALDEATDEADNASPFEGSISGSDPAGNTIHMTASEAREAVKSTPEPTPEG